MNLPNLKSFVQKLNRLVATITKGASTAISQRSNHLKNIVKQLGSNIRTKAVKTLYLKPGTVISVNYGQNHYIFLCIWSQRTGSPSTSKYTHRGTHNRHLIGYVINGIPGFILNPILRAIQENTAFASYVGLKELLNVVLGKRNIRTLILPKCSGMRLIEIESMLGNEGQPGQSGEKGANGATGANGANPG